MKTYQSLARSAMLLIAMVLVLPAQAQTLIDQVPEESALYVGWRGSADMGPDYAGSNLQGVIEQTGLLQAVPQLVDALRELGNNGELPPEMGELIGMGGSLWSTMWTNGGAMYMLPPQADGPPIPRLAILWKKGADNKELSESLNKLVEVANDAEQVPVFLKETDKAYVLSIAFDAATLEFKPLSGAARFQQASTRVQGDGALIVYIDVQEWIGQVDQVAEMMQRRAAEWGEKDPFAQVWLSMREVSGLTGVNQLMLSAGIKDKSWHTQVFLDAPSPRKGILSLLDADPIKPTSLTHVPKSATYLQLFSMDPGKVMDTTRDMLKAVDPNMVEQFNQGIAEANKEIGFDLEEELIRGMGPVWSVYIDPMIAGNGFSSMVMVNELSDPAVVEKALEKLTTLANAAIAREIDDGPFKMRLLTREVNGTTITHLGIPYVSPSWMVKDGRLYVSLFSQGLEMAIEQSGKPADSILANESFKKTIARFGNKPYSGLTFTDLPETAADGYGVNLMIMQTIAGTGEMFTGKASSMRMPPVGKLMPFIEPSGGMSWVDKDGMHMHSIEPFPGSALLGPAKGLESMTAVSGPLAIAVLLPAMGSAREAAMQAQAMSHGRSVAMASIAYAADNKGNIPQDIAALAPYIQDTELFFTPRSVRVRELPFNFAEWDQKRQDRFVRENSSFVIVPSEKVFDVENAAETVLMFQRPDDIGQGAIVVGWVDGHVTNEDDLERIEKLIKAQTGKSMDQLTAQQEAFGGE